MTIDIFKAYAILHIIINYFFFITKKPSSSIKKNKTTVLNDISNIMIAG